MTRYFLLVALSISAFAQNPGDPFTLIRLIRKPAGPAADPSLIGMHRTARVPVDVIGMHSVTGPQESWLIEAHGSFASIETTDKALANVNPTAALAQPGPPTIVGLFRPQLSYRPADAIKTLASARYFYVTLFQTRPGAFSDFAQVVRMRNAALDRVNVDRPELGYHIISGGESDTYLFLAPMTSLATMDDALARMYGHPDLLTTRQVTNQATAEAEITREQLLFRVDPKISFVSEAFAGSSGAFWTGR